MPEKHVAPGFLLDHGNSNLLLLVSLFKLRDQTQAPGGMVTSASCSSDVTLFLHFFACILLFRAYFSCCLNPACAEVRLRLRKRSQRKNLTLNLRCPGNVGSVRQWSLEATALTESPQVCSHKHTTV